MVRQFSDSVEVLLFLLFINWSNRILSFSALVIKGGSGRSSDFLFVLRVCPVWLVLGIDWFKLVDKLSHSLPINESVFRKVELNGIIHLKILGYELPSVSQFCVFYTMMGWGSWQMLRANILALSLSVFRGIGGGPKLNMELLFSSGITQMRHFTEFLFILTTKLFISFYPDNTLRLVFA